MTLMKSQNLKMFMTKSKTEGKLISGYRHIIDVVLQKIAGKIEKDLKNNTEKGIALLNQIGSLVGHKITTDKQQKGKLFLKFGEEIVGEACWDGYKQKGMKKKNGKMVPNCVPEEMEEARNYRKEYDNYQSRPEQKLRRAARNAARRSFKDVPEDKDVHHKDNNPLNNDKKNLSVVSQKYNRTEPRLREKKLKEWLDAAEDVELNNLLQQEEMGTVTGTGIAGTGDDSSTVIVRKKKKVLKRIIDTAKYNKKGGHVK
jgi:hypothetical protein